MRSTAGQPGLMSGYKNSGGRAGESQGDPEPERVALDELLRRRVRELREARGFTREQVANSMCGLGFAWDADHVAAIERGRSKLGLADILGLAHTLRAGWADLVGLPGGLVDITPSWSANGHWMAGVCALEPGAIYTSTMTEREHQQMSQALDSMVEQKTAAEVAATLSERLGRDVSAEEVAEAAVRLWGRGVVAERDRRADKPGATPRQRQAHRAHASRGILRDLEQELAQGPGAPRRSPGRDVRTWEGKDQ